MACRVLGKALCGATASGPKRPSTRDLMPSLYTAMDAAVRCMSSDGQHPRVIDLRSDTVTHPTPEMRHAMATAVVGDDVWGNDPTVAVLQEKAAKMFGMEKALFVPSGTMANLIAVMVHCDKRGAEVLFGDRCHVQQFEQGGISQLGSVHAREVRTHSDGRLDLDDMRSKVRPDDIHHPITSLICLENTHNLCGGRVLRPEYMAQVAEFAKETGLPVHVDGARLMNAAAYLNLPASDLLRGVDSVAVCLSKSLAAPIGSLVAGSGEFYKKALRLRKALGGGLRQSGVLAAPGIIALEVMSQRLHEDHAQAKRLSEGCHALKHLGVDSDPVATETNIILFSVDEAVAGMNANKLSALLAEDEPSVSDESGRGFLLWAITEKSVRAVTNYHITQVEVDAFLAKMKRVLETRC